MDGKSLHTGPLKRGLQNRHIQLIALGGAIGTGLFLGSAGVLKSAGPSMILGYAVAGFIAFLIMRQLGEMIVEEPVAGSFGHFAHKYCGGYAGFLSGWNYWVLYILVGMAELTAVGKYVQFWWPEIPTWATAVVFFLLINGINLASVKVFGETEFWFALVKVVAIIGMILLGIYLLASGDGG
ncbi:MAG: amino acid permease, partial [Pseudomonadota bacterium]